MKKSVIKTGAYIAVAVLCLLVFIFSFTTLTDNGDSYRKSDTFNVEAAADIVETLAKEPRPRTSEAHLNALEYLKNELTDAGADVVEMDYVTTYADAVNFGGYGGIGTLIPNTLVKNLLVEFEGTDSDDILVIQAHTDSVPMGAGAYDDAVPVSSMVESIRWMIKDNVTFKNTVVFLFTDGEEEGLLGARMFAEKRVTHNTVADRYINLMDKVKFVANFEARGTGGTLIMFETTKGNYNTVKNFAKINKDVYTNSIANFVYNSMPNGTDFSAFSNKGVQGLNFANIGEGKNYHTAFDEFKNVDKSVIAQNGRAMQSVLNHFGNTALSDMYKTDNNAVFFSYLDIFTIYYPVAVAIVFAVITLLLLIGAVIFNLKNKKHSIKKVLLALCANLIALAGAVLCLFLFKTIFGAFGLSRILSASSYNSYAVMFGYLFMALAVYTVLSAVFNKLFKSTNEYSVLANCVFVAFLGCVLTFVLPEISFILAVPGFLGAVWVFAAAAFKRFDSKLFLPGIVPFIMMLPISLSLAVLASDALGLSLAWLAVIPTVIAFGYIAPYLTSFKDYLSKLVDASEKTAKPVKKIVSLSNLIVAAVAFVTGLCLFIGGATAPLGLATNIYGKASGRYMLFVDDAIIYNIDLDTDTSKHMMYDKSAYEYLTKNYGLSGEYNSAADGYVLNIDENYTFNESELELSWTKHDGYFELEVSKAFDGMFTISIPLVNGDTTVTRIEVTDDFSTAPYSFEKADFIANMQTNNEIRFRSYSDSNIKIYTTAESLTLKYKENANLDLNSSKINPIAEQERYLITGIQLNKTITMS